MSEYICEREDTRLTVKADGDACEFTLPSWTQREEIVRCRDCRYAHEMLDGMYDCFGHLATTWDYYSDEPKQNPVEPDGFCAWGERREQ